MMTSKEIKIDTKTNGIM